MQMTFFKECLEAFHDWNKYKNFVSITAENNASTANLILSESNFQFLFKGW